MEPPSFTGYEPKHLAEDRDHKHFTEDKHFSEYQILQNTRIHVSDHSSSTDRAWLRPAILLRAYSDWDDEQIRALLVSPLYLQEREANAERSQVYHSVRENLMSSSSQDPKNTERPSALLFSSKNMLNQETFLKRGFCSGHQQIMGNNEPLFGFCDPETSVKSILESHRDHVLAEAKSENHEARM